MIKKINFKNKIFRKKELKQLVYEAFINYGIIRSSLLADDIKNLGKFLQEIQPNLMTSVPRALEKVFAKINNGIEEASFVKKIIGKKALKRALHKDPLASKNLVDKFIE